MIRLGLGIVAVVAVATTVFAFDRQNLEYAYQRVSLKLDPSAAKAFSYGESHFSAQETSAYNIEEADYFFSQVAQLDPTYPYLYHELARIQFLEGHFARALSLIDVQISLHGDTEPNAYYVRGLIKGYVGDYASAQQDYAHYLEFNSYNWAAMNDFAWTLLKGGRIQEAENITTQGLQYYPNNPWLLNSDATARYELGDVQAALAEATAASKFVDNVTTQQWLTAYPGNDPEIAAEGIATFKQAVDNNMHMIALAASSSMIKSQ